MTLTISLSAVPLNLRRRYLPGPRPQSGSLARLTGNSSMSTRPVA